METQDSIHTTRPEPVQIHHEDQTTGTAPVPQTDTETASTAETSGDTERPATPKTDRQVRTERQVRKEAPANVRYFLPKYLSYPPAAADQPVNPRTHQVIAPTDTVALKAAGALPQDTVPKDTVVAGEVMEGIVLIDPAAGYAQPKPVTHGHFAWGGGMSWIYLALAVLFCAVGVKFKGNSRYMKALYTDMTDTRVRHNMFDDTVRETSLLVLLNITWIACVGVLLWKLVTLTVPSLPQFSLSIPDKPAAGIGLCIGVAAIYVCLMLIAYWIVGNVFSERRETRLWVKGAAATTALETFVMFPCALITLAYPTWTFAMLVIAAVAFVFGKIVFLYKGFRIFFNEISSWLLFLYYLCSLEIVPLILTYIAAVVVCSSWL